MVRINKARLKVSITLMGRERGKDILVAQRISEGNSKCVSRVFSCLAVLLEYTYCILYISILPPSYKWKATTSVGSYLSYVFLVIRHHYQSNLYKNFIDAHSFNKCVHGYHSGENGSRWVLGQHLRYYSNPQIGMRERTGSLCKPQCPPTLPSSSNKDTPSK